MTAAERTRLKQLVDQRRRQLAFDNHCLHCGAEIPAEKLRYGAVYCSPNHRRLAWHKTAHGREYTNRKKRERTAARKQQQVAA